MTRFQVSLGVVGWRLVRERRGQASESRPMLALLRVLPQACATCGGNAQAGSGVAPYAPSAVAAAPSAMRQLSTPLSGRSRVSAALVSLHGMGRHASCWAGWRAAISGGCLAEVAHKGAPACTSSAPQACPVALSSSPSSRLRSHEQVGSHEVQQAVLEVHQRPGRKDDEHQLPRVLRREGWLLGEALRS